MLSYFVIYFFKFKIILFYNRVVYHHTRIFLILFPHAAISTFIFRVMLLDFTSDFFLILLNAHFSRLKCISMSRLYILKKFVDLNRYHFLHITLCRPYRLHRFLCHLSILYFRNENLTGNSFIMFRTFRINSRVTLSKAFFVIKVISVNTIIF